MFSKEGSGVAVTLVALTTMNWLLGNICFFLCLGACKFGQNEDEG